jgi:hypothetical protein
MSYKNKIKIDTNHEHHASVYAISLITPLLASDWRMENIPVWQRIYRNRMK